MNVKHSFKTYKTRAAINLYITGTYLQYFLVQKLERQISAGLKSLANPTATHTMDFIPSMDPLKTTGLFHFNKVTLLFAGLGLVRQSNSITVVIIQVLVFKELTYQTPKPLK